MLITFRAIYYKKKILKETIHYEKLRKEIQASKSVDHHLQLLEASILQLFPLNHHPNRLLKLSFSLSQACSMTPLSIFPKFLPPIVLHDYTIIQQ